MDRRQPRNMTSPRMEECAESSLLALDSTKYPLSENKHRFRFVVVGVGVKLVSIIPAFDASFVGHIPRIVESSSSGGADVVILPHNNVPSRPAPPGYLLVHRALVPFRE